MDIHELKALAEGAHGDGFTEDGAFSFRVSGPRAVLELLAEIDRLRTAEGDAMTYKAGMENVAQQRDQIKAEVKRMTSIAYAVHGAFRMETLAERDQLFGQTEQLKAESEESATVIDQLATILAGVAVALKGEEMPLHRHGYHDLVEGVTVLKLENDLRKAENEALRKALREVMNQVDGNIRETVRDCVNGHNDVQDIYGYCDAIEGIVGGALLSE